MAGQESRNEYQHTPGPWMRSARMFQGEPVQYVEASREVVAMNVANAANARLITAAPDLLAALERLADEAETNYLFGEDDGEVAALAAAREAIDKARGTAQEG